MKDAQNQWMLSGWCGAGIVNTRIVNLVSVMAEAGRCNWYRMMVFAIRERSGDHHD